MANGPGINITVTAATAQAAANFNAFATQASAAVSKTASAVATLSSRLDEQFKIMEAGARRTAADFLTTADAAQQIANRLRVSGQLNEVYAAGRQVTQTFTTAGVASEKFSGVTASGLKGASKALSAFAGNLALNASFFAGPGATQFVYPIVLLSKELKGAHAQLKLMGTASLSGAAAGGVLGVGLISLSAIVAAATTAWQAHKAKVEETRSEYRLLQGEAARTQRLLALLRDTLPGGEGDELTRQLGIAEAQLRIRRAAEANNPADPELRARRGAAEDEVAAIKKLIGEKIKSAQATKQEQLDLIELANLDAEYRRDLLSGFDEEREAADRNYRERLQQIQDLANKKLPAGAAALAFTGDAERNKQVVAYSPLSTAVKENTIAALTAAEEVAATKRAEISKRETAEVLKQLAERREAELEDIAVIERERRAAAERAAQRQLNQLDTDFTLRELDLAPNAGSDARIALANEEFTARQTLYDDLVAKGVFTEDQLTDAMAQAEIRRTQIIRTEEQNRIQAKEEAMEAGVSILGSAAAAARLFGQEGFAAWKALALAEAITGGALAVVKQLGSGDPYSAPFRAAAAGVAAAVQIATIAATQPPAFARGGRPSVGQLSLVGEEGPELFVADRPGTILPAAQTARALRTGTSSGRSSGGSEAPRTNINMYPVIDRRALLDVLRDDIEGVALEVFRRRTV